MTILIDPCAPDMVVIPGTPGIECWGSHSCRHMADLLSPFLETTERGRDLYLTVVPLYAGQIRIVQKKNAINKLCRGMCVYDPAYSIFHRDVHVATLEVTVGPWETWYQIHWNPTFLVYTEFHQRPPNAVAFLEWVDILQHMFQTLPMQIVLPYVS